MITEQRIQLSEQDLEQASAVGLLRAQQIAPLWQFLLDRGQVPAPAAVDDRPRFSFTHVLYYLGGMLAIGAMSVFMTLGWQGFGGWGVFFIALLYVGVAWLLARRFEAQELPIPMGIMAALIVVLVPLATWAFRSDRALPSLRGGGRSSPRPSTATGGGGWRRSRGRPR